MRVRLKGINSVPKTLADGSRKTYWYAWKGGPPVKGDPGTPEFIASYNEAVAKKIEPPSGVLLSLLIKFQASGEWEHKIGERTRSDYVKNIQRIERDFGDFPLKALDDKGARAVFLEWRDEMAKRSLRQADYVYQTLRRILSWAVERGHIDTNPCAKGGKLYEGTRVDKIWSDEDVARFLTVAPPHVGLLMMLAVESGQRQGDVRKLTWSAYDGKAIKVRQRKNGAYVAVPVSDALKAELDAAPRRSPVIAVNSEGRPWTLNSLQSAWREVKLRAGIEGLTFHDLRGTAVVRLARAGCTEAEIYSITGHKPSDISAILTAHYLPRDSEVAANAIAKLNAYRARRDQNEDENLPTALPTVLKTVDHRIEKAK
jgi:integrase